MSFWRLAPYAAGGIALSALENKVLGQNIPDPLKKINLGIGLTQGAMFGMPGSKSKLMSLASIPTKQMMIFGLGEAEKFKDQQQALTDTNLNTAKVNESAAKLHLRDAGTSRAIQLAFLIPALVGAGALGYNAYNQFKKDHKSKSKFKNLEESGEHKPNQRLKLEMPISALPDDFVPSLLSARDRAHITVRGRKMDKAASFLGNLGSSIGNTALGFTGIPEFMRAGKDVMHSFGDTQDSDYGNAGRHLLAGAGGLAVGLAGARWGLPMLAPLIGKARLRGVIRNALKGESNQLTEFPSLAKWLYRHSYLGDFRNKPRVSYSGGVLPAINAYDPAKFDWNSPTTSSGLFKHLFTAPAPGAGPKTMLGTGLMGARYAGNRLINAGYGARQLMRRYPNASLMAMGLPVEHMGTAADEDDAAREKAMWERYAPQTPNMGPMGMPVSSVADSILRSMAGSSQPITRQLRGY